MVKTAKNKHLSAHILALQLHTCVVCELQFLLSMHFFSLRAATYCNVKERELGGQLEMI